MESLTELYKIGRGPSSSHSIGPFRATKWFLETFPETHRIIVNLYGSLALTGKGHQTDISIIEAAKEIEAKINFDYKTKPSFPNTLDITGYDQNNKLIKTVTFRSIGGGSIEIEGYPSPVDNKVYPQTNFNQIKKWCCKNDKTLVDYVKHYDEKGYKHLYTVWETMKGAIDEGLNNKEEFNFPGLNFKRKTFIVKNNLIGEYSVYGKLCKIFPDLYGKNSIFQAYLYSYAVAELNSLHGKLVTAPTLGSAGILPAVFYYAYKHLNVPEENIIEALAIAGVIGNVFKTNGSIAGATGGCQAEIGVAVAMAAAGFNYIINGYNLTYIEYAAIIAMEHHLGLTCDPVGGAVIAPCIERNAEAVIRVISSATHSCLVGGRRNSVFTLDDEVDVELKTGRDLKTGYKETSKKGLSIKYKSKKIGENKSINIEDNR